jgi:hypothetical protein
MTAGALNMQWRHKKRGTVYEIVTETASLQCSCDPATEHRFDDEVFVVYRNVKTLAYYVRPYQEFFDGRFEALGDSGDGE